MKIFKYIMLIALIFNNPLLAMNALRKKQTAIAEILQQSAKEEKATATLKKLRLEGPKIDKEQPKVPKSKPISGPGIPEIPITFDQNELEKKTIGTPRGEVVQWYPTTDALTKLLNGYVPLEGGVVVEKSTGEGAMNLALFVAYRNAYQTAKGDTVEKRPLLFLKISRSDLQYIPKQLDALQKGPVGEFNLKALSNRELPIIVLQEMFFIYQDKDNKKYTIEVMHLAHGKIVDTIIQEHNEDDQQWAEKIGKALALFHLEFMNYHDSAVAKNWTTMIHGDFHLGNVLFNEKNSRIYFIDNAEMRIENPYKDLKFLTRLVIYGFDEALAKNDPSRRIINFVFSFIKGYLSVYPLKERKNMAAYLQEKLMSVLEPLTKSAHERRQKFAIELVLQLKTFFTQTSGQQQSIPIPPSLYK